jgi:hypothetical protein
MGKVDAVECDQCGDLVKASEATEKLVRYKGPTVRGEYTQFLDQKCADEDLPEGVELKPWPRMKSGEGADEA